MIRLLQYFVNTTKKAELTVKMTKNEDLRNKQRRKLTSHEVVNYLLRTYATHELSAEDDAEIKQFRQHSRMSFSQYAQELQTKAHNFGTDYTEDCMKGIINEGLRESISLIVRNVWGHNGNDYLQDLGRLETLMKSLGADAVPLPTVQINWHATAVMEVERCQ